jgi:hypothetical protein
MREIPALFSGRKRAPRTTPPHTLPWWPPGFAFLSGLSELVARRRLLLPIQAFIDDSGGSAEQGPALVLAGWMASAEAWTAFSREWTACLNQPPRIRRFKMSDAAGSRGSGDFSGVSQEFRNFKMRKLAEIIARYAIASFVCWIDLAGHASTYGKELEPLTPYHVIFHTVIGAITHELISRGHRERCEIIFDDQGAIGKRARDWYPLLCECLDSPEERAVLPVEPLFRSDDEFLPLQAADMLAWLARRSSMGESPLPWLDQILLRVPRSEFSGGYDRRTMGKDFEYISQLSEDERAEIIDRHRKLFP